MVTMAIFAAIIFLYSIISGGLDRTPVNGAMVYTAVGLVLGSVGLGLLNLDLNAEGLSLMAELTLGLLLFSDAANADLAVLKKSFHIPQRLLLIGLPLTILLGLSIVLHGLSANPLAAALAAKIKRAGSKDK
jgi:NhaP-type Na+/H+ or K+/H+ antiporter